MLVFHIYIYMFRVKEVPFKICIIYRGTPPWNSFTPWMDIYSKLHHRVQLWCKLTFIAI